MSTARTGSEGRTGPKASSTRPSREVQRGKGAGTGRSIGGSLGTLLLTGLGIGLVPVAPGTVGSVPPVLVAFGMATFGAPSGAIDAALIGLALLFGWACVFFGRHAEVRFAREDPPQVVADEIAGQAVVLLLVPWRMPDDAGALTWNATWALAGFCLFRLIDIAKPGPIRRLQSLPAGSGVLADDLLAGVFAAVLLHAGGTAFVHWSP